MEKQHKFSLWYVLLGIWVVLLLQNTIASMFAITTIPYSQFLRLLNENKVAEVAITANQIQGKLRTEGALPEGSMRFRTIRVDAETSPASAATWGYVQRRD
jgi:cell division protease FtsH